jgi:hypothetical protein
MGSFWAHNPPKNVTDGNVSCVLCSCPLGDGLFSRAGPSDAVSEAERLDNVNMLMPGKDVLDALRSLCDRPGCLSDSPFPLGFPVRSRRLKVHGLGSLAFRQR